MVMAAPYRRWAASDYVSCSVSQTVVKVQQLSRLSCDRDETMLMYYAVRECDRLSDQSDDGSDVVGAGSDAL